MLENEYGNSGHLHGAQIFLSGKLYNNASKGNAQARLSKFW